MLVTAPKRVAERVWSKEAALWRPELSIAVAKGTPAKRREALESDADIIVIGRDNLADALPYAEKFNAFVVDELSGFKNRGTARWKAAKKLADKIPVFWGLTGTPSPNGLLDLWGQIALMDNGARLGKNITAYRTRFFNPGRQLPTGVVTEWFLKPGAEAKIHSLIDDICLSMESDGRIDLPSITKNLVEVDLPPAAKKAYRDMKNTFVSEIAGGEIHTAANAAVMSSKLSQITAGFLYHDEGEGSYDVLHTEKIKAVREIVDGTGSPVLVFYHFKSELEALKKEFPEARTVDEPGVLDDWDMGQVPVMLAHPASAGHGLNLQHGGHTIVWTTPTWSLEEWDQANKRLARQGQKHPVVIHVLVAPGTVDKAILDRLESKSSVQTALMKHLESPL